MARPTRYLIQTYAHPALADRLRVLGVLREFGCEISHSQVSSDPPFDAPEGTTLARVFTVDLPTKLTPADTQVLTTRLKATCVVQYLLEV